MGGRGRGRGRARPQWNAKATDIGSLNPLAREYVPPPQAQTPPVPQKRDYSRGRGRGRGRGRSRKKGGRSQAPRDRSEFEGTELGTLIASGLKEETYECMICMNKIRRKAAVWSCKTCFVVLHLDCVLKWSSSEASAVTEATNEAVADNWRCPGCQATQTVLPSKYYCFCMKAVNPSYDPFITPHSCGEVCGKKRGNGCPHSCSDQCHPGNCPPCSAMAPARPCFCGKMQFVPRCGTTESMHGKTCGAECGKVLACGNPDHTCHKICHSGPCDPCSITNEQTCHCGRVTEQRSCGSGAFSCGQICGKKRDCGVHVCEKSCHDGECDPCERLHRRVCGCGRNPAPAPASCEEPVVSCGGICGKDLQCGLHTCQAVCHGGECPSCTVERVKHCRCGRQNKSVICSEYAEEFTCQRRCKMMRQCRRHQCNRICCPLDVPPGHAATEAGDLDHLCPLPCGRSLSCGNHVCEQLCHPGQCPPCPRRSYDELACACGKTVILPPVECGTQPPECPYPCMKPRDCGHNTSQHNCHFGPCPPCTYLTEVQCLGGHMLRRHIPCHLATSGVSCGQTCGKPLPCGHKCNKRCHAGPCYDDPEARCKQLCGVRRECGHPCPMPCHAGKCPSLIESPCTVMVPRVCQCGLRHDEVMCCDMCPLECDENCAVEARNAALADALGIEQSEPVATDGGVYSKLLKMGVSLDQPAVVRIERMFEDMLAERSTEAVLPPMTRTERRDVFVLAEIWGLVARSVGVEPSKYMIVVPGKYAKKPKSRLSHVMSSPVMQSSPECASGGHWLDGSWLLCDIKEGATTSDLLARVEATDPDLAMKCRIIWLDDDNACVVSDEPERAALLLEDMAGSIKLWDGKMPMNTWKYTTAKHAAPPMRKEESDEVVEPTVWSTLNDLDEQLELGEWDQPAQSSAWSDSSSPRQPVNDTLDDWDQ